MADASSTIRPLRVAMLPEIARAVGRQGAALIVDGGVRRGTDMPQKAVGLGATACSIGRPFLWGLTAGGQEGAGEGDRAAAPRALDVAMILLGVARTLSRGRRIICVPAQRRTRT